MNPFEVICRTSIALCGFVAIGAVIVGAGYLINKIPEKIRNAISISLLIIGCVAVIVFGVTGFIWYT